MEIRRVRVKNIRSFKGATLELASGTTLLWGDVGTGKTSLLHAIEMALFGFAELDATYLIRHRANTAEVALTIADDGHEYVFSRRFHRKMRRGRDTFEPDEKGTGLTKDGATTLYAPTELRRQAIDLLGFPDNPNPRAHSDLWRWAVYVPQEKMRQILDAEDAEARLETVRKALGLERYRTAADNAQLLAKDLRRDAEERLRESERLRHWESDLARHREAVRAAALKQQGAEKDVLLARESVRAAGLALQEAEGRRVRVEGDRRAMAEVERGLRQSQTLLAELDRRLSEATARAETLRVEAGSLERSSAELEEVRSERDKATQDVLRLAKALERLEEGRRALEVSEAERRSASEREIEAGESHRRAQTRRAEAEELLEQACRETPAETPALPTPRTLPEIEEAVAIASSEVEGLAGEVRQSEVALQEVEELLRRGVCPRCGQSVTPSSFAGHRDEAARAFETGRSAYRAAADRRDALIAERAAREGFERAHLLWREGERRRESAKAELERADTELGRLELEQGSRRAARELAESEVEALSPKASGWEEGRDRLRASQESVRALDGRIVALVEAAASARGRREALADAEEASRSILEARSEAAHRISDLRGRVQELQAALAAAGDLTGALAELAERQTGAAAALEAAIGRQHRAEAEGESFRERVTEAERGVEERRLILEESARLRAIAEFLQGRFREVLLRLEHRLLAAAKVEFDRSFSRFFAALIEDPSLVARSDPRFSPWVEIEGESTPAEALSGGERTALALAFRLALREVVRRAGRLRLSTLILDEPTDGFSPEQVERMGELFRELAIPQLLLVSHESILEGAADRTVRVTKVGGSSELEGERSESKRRPRSEERTELRLVPGR